jgi:hypothetical protein
MTEVYVIRNQFGHYWGKGKAWVDGSEARAVMRSPHRDEATNTLVELSAKDVELRGEVMAVSLTERGEPEVEASDIPVPLTAEQMAAEEAARLAGEHAEAGQPEPQSEPAEAPASDDSNEKPPAGVAAGSA